MVMTGITRSEFEDSLKWLCNFDETEATRLEQEAAKWEGKAEAYGTIWNTAYWSFWQTTYWRNWYHYGWSTMPSESCQNAARQCRENATACRVQAQKHRANLKAQAVNQMLVIADDLFDRERRSDS